MKLAVDIHLEGEGAVAAAVCFDEWGAPEASRTCVSRIASVEKPARGALDLRLPTSVLQLLREHALAPDVIVFEGFVHLDAQETPGPGWHLHHALGGRTAVIGVSKSPMRETPAQFEVFREAEAPGVVVTCAGIDLGAAKARVAAMHGRKRMPTLLKLAARVAKGAG